MRYWFGVFFIVSVISGIGLGVGEQLTDLFYLAERSFPHFVPEHGWFLYLWIPLVTLSACILLTLPGLALSLCFSSARSTFTGWLLGGFFISIILLPGLAAGLNHLTGGPISPRLFWLLCIFLGGLALLYLLIVREEHHQTIFDRRGRDLVAMILTPLVILLLLNAKFYWETANGDGAHEFLATLQFLQTGNPFWPEGAGTLGGHPAMSAVLPFFPETGLTLLLGESLFSIRVNFLLGVGVLLGVLLGFVRKTDSEETSLFLLITLMTALVFFACANAYFFSYNPYFADIALPGNREPYVLLAFLGFVWFTHRMNALLMLVFAFICYVTSPSGLILVGFWIAANFISGWPLAWKQTIFAGISLVLGVGVAVALFSWLVQNGLATSSGEFGPEAILKRLRFVTYEHYERLAYWIVPAGILPVLALVLIPWQDRVSRGLTYTTIAYVAFFYFQAYRILPHHFAPAMILPLIVAWRTMPRFLPRPVFAIASLAAIGGAAFLSIPPSFNPHIKTRDIGQQTQLNAPEEYFSYPHFSAAQALLDQVFPAFFGDEEHTTRLFIDFPSIMAHSRLTRAYELEPNLVISDPSSNLDPSLTRIGEPVDGFVIYVRDLAKLDADKTAAEVERSIPDLYVVRRSTMFGHGVRETMPRVWDLKEVYDRFR